MNDLDGLRDEALSRLYRKNATAEPPPRIDAAILAAAQAEAGRVENKRSSSPWRQWLPAVSFAAVATLALALSFLVPWDMEREHSLAEEASALHRDQSVSKPTSAPPSDKAVAAPSAAAPPEMLPPPARREAKSSPPDTATEMKPKPAPKARSADSLEERPPRVDSAFEPSPWPGAAAPPPPATETDGAKGLLGERRPTPFGAQRQREAPAAAVKALPPAPAPAGQPEQRAADAAPPADTGRGSESFPAESARSKKLERPESSTESLLEEIRSLRRQGRVEEAARAVAVFRRAYPAYVLPEDLRDLAP